MSPEAASNRLAAFLRAAQYLSNLTLQQDPWAEWGQALNSFFKCDPVLIVKADPGGAPELVHGFSGGLPVAELLALTQGEVRAVLESGFLGAQTLAAPSCALAFLPLARDRRTAAVAIVGRAGTEPFTREDLEILLALGSLLANVIARLETERELRNIQQHLEHLIGTRTVELATTNARLLEESAQRRQEEVLRREAEAYLQQAQKMESLGSLAGGVAHDMNNVLGAILSLASAHLTIQPRDTPAYPAFETIRDAAMRGGGMVKRLLNFARQNPLESHPLDLNALVREEALLLERTTLARVQLDLDLAPDLQPIHGDANALTHAIMNLCVNAVDAMPHGGRLTLATRNQEGAQVELIVADTGCGMAKEVLDRALDPFFTTKEVGKGTGLGLPLVFNAVKAHQGRMEILSRTGEGTQVKLRFPAALPGAHDPATLPVAPAEPGRAGLHVFLVDDDDLIQKSTGMLIEILGHSVTHAGSGEEAVAMVEQGARPDLVILDMNMPGWGGLGTLPRLRALCPAMPVFLSTGRTDQDALDLVAGHAHVNLLSKPFTIDELKWRLDALGT